MRKNKELKSTYSNVNLIELTDSEPRTDEEREEAIYLAQYGIDWRRDNQYVSKKKFYDVMVKYREDMDKAKSEGKPIPPIPDFGAKAIVAICVNLARRANFHGYSFRGEMISEGIETCLTAFPKFDVTKSQNPFAYFTTTAWYAFIKIIKDERKQSVIRGMVMREFDFDEGSTFQDGDESMRSLYHDYLKQQNTLIEVAEDEDRKRKIRADEKRAKLAEEKAKQPNVKVVKPLDEFFEMGDDEEMEVEEDASYIQNEDDMPEELKKELNEEEQFE